MNAKTCAHCGEPIVRESAGGRPPRYCGRSCRQRAYEGRQLAAAVRAAVAEQASRDETPEKGVRVPSAEVGASRDETPEGSAFPPPSPEFLDELGMTAAQFEDWRRKVLSRPLEMPGE